MFSTASHSKIPKVSLTNKELILYLKISLHDWLVFLLACESNFISKIKVRDRGLEFSLGNDILN